MTIFQDEIFNNKAFEHASLIFTEPRALKNEIKLTIVLFFWKIFILLLKERFTIITKTQLYNNKITIIK